MATSKNKTVPPCPTANRIRELLDSLSQDDWVMLMERSLREIQTLEGRNAELESQCAQKDRVIALMVGRLNALEQSVEKASV